jgi:hypothetical protein
LEAVCRQGDLRRRLWLQAGHRVALSAPVISVDEAMKGKYFGKNIQAALWDRLYRSHNHEGT